MPVKAKRSFKRSRCVVDAASQKWNPWSKRGYRRRLRSGSKRDAQCLYATYQYLYEQDSKDLDAAIHTLRHLKES